MRKLLILGSAALAVLVAAPVGQAAPNGDLIAGSGTWSGGYFGTPTMNVSANDEGPIRKNKFTFDYKDSGGETIYLVQGKIEDFEVTGTTACLVGEVTKEQGQDPASPTNSRFEVDQYVPIAISEGGSTGYLFNFGTSDPTQPGLCTIAPGLPFDAGTAEFAIVDAG
jgi:hypothetical protein